MKKVLALVLIVGIAQGSSSKWEREQINLKKDNRLRTMNYGEFHGGGDLRRVCEVAPYGWTSKYPVQRACDILYQQFNEIERTVKNAIKDNAKETNLEYSQFVAEHKNLIKEEEVEQLTEIILDRECKRETAWLMNTYQEHFNTVVKNKLRENNLRELSNKYSN